MMTPSSELSLLAPRPLLASALLAESDREPSLSKTLKTLLFTAPATDRRPARDRRATPRFEVDVVCEAGLPGAPRHYGMTFDLSTFGLATRGGTGYAIGETLELVLHLPDGHPSGPLALTAEVLGVHEESGGTRMAFRRPPALAARRLHRYLFGQVAVVQARA